jgi:hypothetical protein
LTARRRSVVVLPQKILHGSQEPIFAVLPQTILSNFLIPKSESALLWNRLYPVSHPHLALSQVLALKPLWGTALSGTGEDWLRPFFWGYAVDGERLPMLDEVLEEIDGPGQQTEVDCFLLGKRQLILLEAKLGAAPGRCSRYQRRACPEIHGRLEDATPGCRYWEPGAAAFNRLLAFGDRPTPASDSPPCGAHYQLGRMALVGSLLASRLGLSPHLWLVAPGWRWPGLEKRWLDFASRVRDEGLWRQMRVLSWEALQTLPAAGR